MDNHWDQDQEIHQDKVVEKMDRKFESPKIKLKNRVFIVIPTSCALPKTVPLLQRVYQKKQLSFFINPIISNQTVIQSQINIFIFMSISY